MIVGKADALDFCMAEGLITHSHLVIERSSCSSASKGPLHLICLDFSASTTAIGRQFKDLIQDGPNIDMSMNLIHIDLEYVLQKKTSGAMRQT